MHILGQKESTWNTIFSILSDGGAPQTSRGPGKLPPLDGPDTLSRQLMIIQVARSYADDTYDYQSHKHQAHSVQSAVMTACVVVLHAESSPG